MPPPAAPLFQPPLRLFQLPLFQPALFQPPLFQPPLFRPPLLLLLSHGQQPPPLSQLPVLLCRHRARLLAGARRGRRETKQQVEVHIPHAQVEEVLRGQQARVGSGQSAGADLGGWGGGSEGQKSRLPQTRQQTRTESQTARIACRVRVAWRTSS